MTGCILAGLGAAAGGGVVAFYLVRRWARALPLEAELARARSGAELEELEALAEAEAAELDRIRREADPRVRLARLARYINERRRQ